MRERDHDRIHPRLKGYDYGKGGVYFLTLCAKKRAEIFSRIIRRTGSDDHLPVGRDAPGAPLAEVQLLDIGRIVERHLLRTEEAYPGVQICHYVIMPNHIHILVSLPEGAPRASRPTQFVPRMVTAIKRFTNQEVGENIWQTSYHDHIIRNEADCLAHWAYIDANPAHWTEDEYYCE